MTNLGCLGLLIWLLPAFTVLALETGVEEISKFEKFSETQANISLWLSAAAYCPKDTYRTRDFLGPTEGFIVHSDFEYEEFDLQGYTGYLHSDRSIYVVFRGSHDTRNWIVNLNAFKTNYTLYPECQCEVHEGFYNALAKVSDRLIKDVLQAQERHPLYQVKVTGHSLGAALAQLFAMNLNKIGISASVYNFGQPRVGDPNYALFAYQKLPLYFRVTHNRDTVPHLPFTFEMAFYHSCYEVFENEEGFVRTCRLSCEDITCADKFPLVMTDVDDHLTYLGMRVNCDAVS